MDKRFGEGIEFVSVGNVAVKGLGIKLSQHIHLTNAGIEAVTDWNINKTIFSRERDGRFCPAVGKWG